MAPDTLERLIGLALVAGVALIGLWLLIRTETRTPAAHEPGYPPGRFPAQDLVRSGALAELAASQARLLAMRAQLPARSEAAIWLDTLLGELRVVMDSAYRATLATRAYGPPAALTTLAADVAVIEREVAEHIARHLLNYGSDDQSELIAARLAALRLCAHELSI